MKEIDLHFVLDRAKRGWRTCLVFVALAMIAVLAYLPFQTPSYRVKMTVMPVPSEQGQISSGSGGGALTSLLGIGQGQDSNYIRYQKLLTSPAVAQRMQDKHQMLQVVFSSNWDPQDKKWVPIQTMRGFLTGWLLRLAHVPTWTKPDVSALSDYLTNKLLIVPSADSDLVTISMDGPDIAFSKRIMLDAHEQANDVLRDQVARRARQQVAYLEGKLTETQVADYRATLLAILSSQEKSLMLTQTNASFAAELVGQPVASATPVSPRPVLSLAIAIVVGVLLGLLTVVLFGPDWFQMLREQVRLPAVRLGGSGRPSQNAGR